MPAMLDDPSAPTIYRTSGSAPFPDPHDTNPALPPDVYPRQVTLRDRVTVATIVPFASQSQVPPSLLAYLSDQFRKEVELGDTYPMIDVMPQEKFASYWFQNFGAVMLLGSLESANEVVEGKNWATECLGSYYIKPNYPGRSSHVCNAGFLVTDAARGRGVGRLLGESYLDWAPRLGYTYSVFNLGQMAPTSLRSAATHYKLLPDEDKLMLKGKEVISDPQKQYEIARGIHILQHGGINKTTAIIAEKYHWVRIKETVSLVIKNCGECKDLGKAPVVKPESQAQLARQPTPKKLDVVDANILSLPEQHHHLQQQHHQHAHPSNLQLDYQQIQHHHHDHHHDHSSTSVSPQVLNRRLPSPSPLSHPNPPIHHKQHQPPISQMQLHHAESRTKAQSQSHSPSHRHPTADYLQIDPQIMDYTHTPHSTQHFETHHEHDTNSFQAMLGDRDADVDGVVEDERSVVDGDIDDMLVDQDEVEVEGQLGDLGTVEDHNLVGDVISNKMVDDTIGNERHKSDDDVMATARAAQEMISGAVIEGNSQWE
ncbi:hypothetical protein EYC80_007445 [Monilinia laxa]|uniref:Zinc finger H2C2-type histone UAS binding domain-containing protein n=1 Tax=Monilinia laxa TaxID=61186 RepID=A0A5N6JVH1_MONLA|nr:hypothetical protein EYC80_007445 [Monilinia laxa]